MIIRWATMAGFFALISAPWFSKPDIYYVFAISCLSLILGATQGIND